MRATRRLAPMIISLAAIIACGAALLSCRKSALQPNLPQIYSPPPTALREGKPPIIFIPGILGSRLVNRRTGETVWPDLLVDGDQIALPISAPAPALNTDDIVATEVVEEAKVSMLIPEVSIYGPMLKALEIYGGLPGASPYTPRPRDDAGARRRLRHSLRLSLRLAARHRRIGAVARLEDRRAQAAARPARSALRHCGAFDGRAGRALLRDVRRARPYGGRRRGARLVGS